MALELVAARLIARDLGSSLYTWTSVIGIVLAGITLGNYLGGRIADRYNARKTLAVLFTIASVMCVLTVIANNLVGDWKLLWQLSWPVRIFAHISLVFLLPATMLGTISPVVAKMALDLGQATGRTVGDIYAWGAAGSIAGTFTAGYYLIAAMGTIAIVWTIAAVLLLIGIAYWARHWIFYAWMLLLAAGFMMATTSWSWAQETGEALALREKPDPNIIYEDESQYCYIAVKQIRQDPDTRMFYQDTLTHSQINMEDISDLQWTYMVIYDAVTRHFARDKPKLSIMVIGGGGYVLPRHIEKIWPGSRIDVVEIDPRVTEAAIKGFGLARHSSIKTIHMDARNYIDELVQQELEHGEKTRFDFIYEDAINDYSVPFQLTTREFNDKINRLLNDDGAYIVNIIDTLDSSLFLGAMVGTLQKTFPYVTVICESGVPGTYPNNFVLVATKRAPDREQLHRALQGTDMPLRCLSEAEIHTAREKTAHLILTDDYAPVENLLAPVVRQKAAVIMATEYSKQAADLVAAGSPQLALDMCEKVVTANPANHLKGYNNIGVLLLKHGEYALAIRALKISLEALAHAKYEPDALEIAYLYHNLAAAMRKIDRPAEARRHYASAAEYYRRYIPVDPHSAKIHFLTGKSLDGAKNIAEAEKYFAQALELDPANFTYHLELIKNLQLQRRYDQAVNRLKESIAFMSKRGREEDAAQLQKQFDLIKNKYLP